MINVILFGTGKASFIVKSSLKSEVNIVCYCDNDKSKWNTIHEGKKVINPKVISNIEYDYILIASQFNSTIYKQLIKQGISNKKILQFYLYIDYCENIISSKMKRYLDNENCEVIATGLSYMDYALASAGNITNLFNFANPSQDLFYDYNIVKFIQENYPEKIKQLKCVLIGLSYYSFQYDMSLSAMKGKVPLYYDVLEKSHNFNEVNKVLNMIETNNEIAKKVLNLDENNYPRINWNEDVEKKMNVNEVEGKKQADLDCQKKYPITVRENYDILSSYLELLNKYNIHPIILICPVSKYYFKNFSIKMKKEFYQIISELKEKYFFEFIDLFQSDEFFDNDFYDVSHLNFDGSRKFVEKLQNILCSQNITLNEFLN